MMERACELRVNIIAYDVALAEALDRSLITADRRLPNAPMTTCTTGVLAICGLFGHAGHRSDQGPGTTRVASIAVRIQRPLTSVGAFEKLPWGGWHDRSWQMVRRQLLGAVTAAMLLAVGCGSTPASSGAEPVALPPPSESRPTIAAAPDIDAPTSEPGRTASTVPSVVAPAESVESQISMYGPPNRGFAVVGEPEGLRVTEIPLTDAVGPVGEVIVSQRFTAKQLDSQVTITRQTNTDIQRLVEKFEEAKAVPETQTISTEVGDLKSPGYLYQDVGSGWRGLMWVVSDDSAMWVFGSGMTDEQLLSIAQHVEVSK